MWKYLSKVEENQIIPIIFISSKIWENGIWFKQDPIYLLLFLSFNIQWQVGLDDKNESYKGLDGTPLPHPQWNFMFWYFYFPLLIGHFYLITNMVSIQSILYFVLSVKLASEFSQCVAGFFCFSLKSNCGVGAFCFFVADSADY